MNNRQDDDYFKASLALSVLVHVIVIIIFIFGTPSWFQKLPDEQQIITFEMLTVSDIANIKTQNDKKQEALESEESRKIVKSKAEKEPEKPKDEAPKEEVKDEPKQEEPKPEPKEAEIVPTKEEIKKPKDEKKKEDKKDEKKKPDPKKDKKDEKKKPKKKEEDSIDAILKTLEESSEGKDSRSKKKSKSASENDGKFARGDNFNEDSPLSITEMLLIRQQLERNWHPPIGVKNLEEIIVRLHLSLEIDGTVKEVKILSTACPSGSGETCKLVAESALRAARQASPFQGLPEGRYSIWKELPVDFDPSSIAQ